MNPNVPAEMVAVALVASAEGALKSRPHKATAVPAMVLRSLNILRSLLSWSALSDPGWTKLN
jgi:hypothetical protein